MASEISAKSSHRAHVLAVPYGGLVGHINPLMRLCQQLAAEGVAVTFGYSQSYYERSSQAAFMQGQDPNSSAVDANAQLCSSNDNIRIIGLRDGLVYQKTPSRESALLLCQSAIAVEEELVELAHKTQDPPITCIITDVFVVSASSAAWRLGIPHVAFWTQSAASFAAHVVATKDYSSLRGSEAGDGAVITCIPGCPPLKLHELPTFLQSLDPTEYAFSFLTKCFANVENCPHILLNTFDELERDSINFINKRQNMCAVGPLLPRDYGKMNPTSASTDDKSLTWLDMQKAKSVLFVSFGSLAAMSEAQIEELAAGLEASGCPFLMVVRDALVEGHSARFLTNFQDKMLMSGQALFVSWAPQLQVLAHPSIGGFLTHCGWNSTLEGICNGLPLLCWPFFADQMINSRCIVDAWGIGLEFKEESNPSINVSLVTCNYIADKIKYLMAPSLSASIRNRSNQLRMAASKAVLHDRASSHLKLQSFVAWLQEMA